MNPLKKGMIIKDRDYEFEVLEVLNDLVFIPSKYTHAALAYPYQELIDLGYTWEEEEWEPVEYTDYWFISALGELGKIHWTNDEDDRKRQDFLGVYETREKAEQALQEIKRKLGK